MEFQKERVFTSLNADELKVGDKVIVGDTLGELQRCIGVDKPTPIVNIKSIDEVARFNTIYGGYVLAYLVERKDNCTNCVHREGERCKPNVSPINCCPCYDKEVKQSYIEQKTDTKVHLCQNCVYAYPECPAKVSDCEFGNGVGDDNIYKCKVFKPKTEKHYRPFKNTDELIKVWNEKRQRYGVYGWQDEIEMPLIWIKHKKCPIITLISGFHDAGIGTKVSSWVVTWEELLNSFTFLDGSSCGVEE